MPKEWKVLRLGDKKIADLIMGQSPPSSTYNNKKIGLPFLQGSAEFGVMYPTPNLSCSQPIKVAEKNDILISVRAPVGEINITLVKSCIGRGLAAIRTRSDKLNYRFLFYFLKSSGNKFESVSMGSTFKAIRKEELENFSIIVPPLPEQKKIADILSTVDQGIKKVDKAMEKTQRLKLGLMRELLTKGIGHKEFKNTEIGRIPKEWKVKKIHEAFDVYGGTTPSTSNKDYWNGEILWVTPTDVTRLGGNIHIEKTEKKITGRAVKENSLSIFQKDTLLLTSRATIGLTAINKEPVTVNQGMTALLPKEMGEIYSLFYAYYFQILKSYLNQLGSGSTFREISKSTIRNISIPKPSLLEQLKIAEILSTVDDKLELLRKRKEKLERIKRGLMNGLLTGRKRVRLEAGDEIH